MLRRPVEPAAVNGGVILAPMAKAPRKSAALKRAPILENGKVRSSGRNRKALETQSRAAPCSSIPPRRTSNAFRRSREYLTPAEVEKLLQASAKVGRHGARDRTLILLAYRHGLRVSELVALRWDQIDLKAGLVHVARLKNGLPSTQPIRDPELRALRREYPESPYLFVTERGGPMTPATARKLIARAGELAKFSFPIHPHMLRHSAGYKLANDGHDTRSIQQYLAHTMHEGCGFGDHTFEYRGVEA
jgi:integrase